MSVIKKPRLIYKHLHSRGGDVGGGTNVSNNDEVSASLTMTQFEGAVPVSGLYQCGVCSEKFDVPDSLIAHVKKGLHFQNTEASKKSKPMRSNVNAYEFADVIISPVDSEEDDDSSKSWKSVPESDFGFPDFETDTGSNSSGSGNSIPHMAGNKFTGVILECPQSEVSQTKRFDDGSERKAGSFMCLCCSEVFSSVIVVNNHRVLHGIECSKCNGIFPSKSDYGNHFCAAGEDNVKEELQEEEEAVLNNDLGRSKKKGLTPKTFASDVLIEPTEDGWFRCKICSKVCQARSDMSKHVRRHTNERPFSCEICGERFKHQSAIASHLRIHTGERPYTCSFIGCGRKFSQPSNMKRHEALHRGEKPFHCEICEFRFSEKSTLQTHMLQHTGERPFLCRLCGKGHVTNSALKNHMRSRHRQDFETERSSVDEPILYPNQYPLKIDYV